MAPESIVCFSANDWNDIPSSKFHIMKYLGERHKVLYVETIGLRNPHLTSRDAKRALGKLRKSFSGLRNVEKNIYVWSPFAIPYHGLSMVNRFNSYSVATMVKRFMARIGMSDPIIWTYLPNAVDIIDNLPSSQTIYHCIDDYAQFTDVPKGAFERMERRMLQRADLTVVSAKALYQGKLPYTKRITYIPHGVDLTMFRKRLAEKVKLEDIDGIKKPIAGFVGRIADWIDLPLIAKTATELPSWNFVLVGPSNVNVSAYSQIPNLHFLGRKAFHDIPHYIQRFDVCLMPFVDNALVSSVNPLKMYEYLAVGKPVVTVPMVELASFAHLLTIAKPPEFSTAIETAFKTDTESKRTRRIDCVAGRSWGNIAEEILDLLRQIRRSEHRCVTDSGETPMLRNA